MLNRNRSMVRPGPSTAPGPNGLDPSRASATRRRGPLHADPGRRALTVAVALLAGALAMSWWPGIGSSRLRAIGGGPAPGVAADERGAGRRAWFDAPDRPWDGLVRLDESALAAIGLTMATAEPQTGPIRLDVLGTTAYMADLRTIIRPMFRGRADKVHVAIGQAVEPGDPLIELFSTELAEAKGQYETASSQWTRDRRVLDYRAPLARGDTLPRRELIDLENVEAQSRLKMKLARDKLSLYGLTAAEIARIEHEEGEHKARLTLRSPAGGIVISRDVASGNLYDPGDTLLVIAPPDRLWVWGHVPESDIDRIRVGQPWEILFPDLDSGLRATIEILDAQVDPGTRAMRIRTSIPNPGHRLKSDMLVRGTLEVPPLPGHVVIPRTALIVGDGPDHVFVKVPGAAGKFERRTVRIAHERRGHVVIDQGLRAGEEVVLAGSLILAQTYEDLRSTRADAPPGDG
jgi:cobalt-zinc-cadmium efflux system membrane fusion protein